jgi:hypothetical protein
MADTRRKETPESEVFGTEEALAKMMMELLNPTEQKLFTVTDITPDEVFSLSILLRYAKKFSSILIENWVRDFLKLRISRLRLGRREFLLLGTGIRELTEEKKKGKRLTDMFAGMK